MVRFTSDEIIRATGWQATWTSGPPNEPSHREHHRARDGQRVDGIVAITADAADSDGTVARVELELADGMRARDDAAPFAFELDTEFAIRRPERHPGPGVR